tara:strand:- start:1277 stop:1504 length:228 start_codon:yes stop_codon:yes gene_type:complete
MKDIIVEFSGWIRIEPKKAKFVCIGSDGPDINGEQWLALDEDARFDYILESVIDAQRDSHDGDYDHIDVFEDDSI